MKTTDELVRELADREAIRELTARYCDCVWRKDIDGIVNLFVGDGAFIVEGLEEEAVARGHAGLRKVYEKSIAEINARLFVHNQIFNLHGGNHATGRCYVEVFGGKASIDRIGLGFYEDEYSKSDNEWKFASRRYFLDVIDTAVSLRTFIV